MKYLLLILFALCSVSFGQGEYVPEEGSVEESKGKKSKKLKVDSSLPIELILGDSISIG
ncbi:MAG: hypothetical protein ABGY95_07130 [Rubritalea sp.]|uniref:hypothetical protein n=1 Tax=Rubritalea sp. TaxID=2109375 RepID=UPI003241CAC9